MEHSRMQLAATARRNNKTGEETQQARPAEFLAPHSRGTGKVSVPL